MMVCKKIEIITWRTAEDIYSFKRRFKLHLDLNVCKWIWNKVCPANYLNEEYCNQGG